MLNNECISIPELTWFISRIFIKLYLSEYLVISIHLSTCYSWLSCHSMSIFYLLKNRCHHCPMHGFFVNQTKLLLVLFLICSHTSLSTLHIVHSQVKNFDQRLFMAVLRWIWNVSLCIFVCIWKFSILKYSSVI